MRVSPVKGLTLMFHNIYNSWHVENLRFDKLQPEKPDGPYDR